MAAELEDLSEDEKYLWAILSDVSGLDLAEFTWFEPSDHATDGCWRARPYQWHWFRCSDPLQLDCCARSVGKSLSIKLRAFAFPFLWPGKEMVVTAPELNHLLAIAELIEDKFISTRIGTEMIITERGGITHKPFSIKFRNSARIMGRIPQKDGKGVKGCAAEGELVLTDIGLTPVEELTVGTNVLTHEGRWKPITHIFPDINDCYEVAGQSSFPLTVSCDHRFLGMANTGTAKTKRKFEPPMFHDVEELTDYQVYWASPTQFPSLPIPGGVPSNEAFWWLVGRWVADGHRSMDKKNNKARRIAWSVHPKDQQEVIERLDALEWHYSIIKRDHSSADTITHASAHLYEWLFEHFGEHANGKSLPTFALGMDESFRRALLDGYLAGDGHWAASRQRWEIGTASKALAVGLQLLAQSLGYTVNCSEVQPTTTEIMGVPLKNKPQISYRLQLLATGHPILENNNLFSKIKSVTPVGKKKVYDIKVEEDHSYTTGSIISHNLHPLWLELDEAQDYPHAGWTELIETLQRDVDGSVWRAHGVTKGVRDDFYKFSQPGTQWTVHRITAMHRPGWSDAERQEKIEMYGSTNDPDYKRNVLGEHGDATNPIFVLSRFAACCDDRMDSEYNTEEYVHITLTDGDVELEQGNWRALLTLPTHHLAKYKTFWIGMDVGLTNDPSEILVFAEHRLSTEERRELKKVEKDDYGIPLPTKAVPLNDETRFKLVLRVSLQRIASPDQEDIIGALIEHYNPKRFAMDATGNGLPVYQGAQRKLPKDRRKLLRGYKFNQNVLVGFDEEELAKLDEWADEDDMISAAAINASVLEYSTEVLRKLVDQKRLWLPWDLEVIGDFQDPTYIVSKAGKDSYGRKKYCVDEATQALTRTGWKTHEELLPADELWTYNPTTRAGEWQSINRVFRFEGTHEMLHMHSTTHDSLTTLEHRWPIERMRNNHARTDYWWAFKDFWTSQDILDRNNITGYRIPTGSPSSTYPTGTHSDDFVALMAWYICEGNYYLDPSKHVPQLTISQSHTVNPLHARDIQTALQNTGTKYSSTQSTKTTAWRIQGDLRNEILTWCPDQSKTLSFDFLHTLTEDQLWLFVDTCIRADGWISDSTHGGTRTGFAQRNKHTTELFATACQMLGFAVSFNTSTTKDGEIMYGCNVKQTKGITLHNTTRSIVEHQGIVWCPQTDNSTWMARRNGKTFFTGNSEGHWHNLDGARMAALAWKLYSIEELITHKEGKHEDVIDQPVYY